MLISKKIVIFNLLFGLAHVIVAQNKDSLERFIDKSGSRNNFFIELGGSSLGGSVGYAERYFFKKKYFLEGKVGVLYWQKLINPIYDDYYLVPHVEGSFNMIHKKIILFTGASYTPILNPFLMIHKNYNCNGPTTCNRGYYRTTVVGFNIGIGHRIRRKLELKYKASLLHFISVKKSLFPWIGITLYYNL